MKKVIVLLTVIVFTNIKDVSAQVSLEIDRKIFVHKIQGAYYSKDKEAVFMSFLLKQNADVLINTNASEYGEGVKVGFIEGTKIFYINEQELRDDKLYSMFSFIKKVSENQMISINSGFPSEDEEIYYKTIIDAVKSAKLK